MSDSERITGLIGDIYGAVLDASLWPRVLRGAMANPPAPPGKEAPADRRATLRLLAPHFRRALAIARRLERSESLSAALGEVLERLSSAVVIVDSGGRFVHANEAATKMLAANEVLGWQAGKPRPKDERAAAHLEALLAAAQRGRPGTDCCALSVAQCAPDGERMTLHILPLSATGRRRARAPSAAAAAIVVSRETWSLPQRLQSAARLYALTPAESRVVSVLLTGCTIGSAAKALGVKQATVKTHLQHVFDKTGIRRQIDLARRIAAPESALSGHEANGR